MLLPAVYILCFSLPKAKNLLRSVSVSGKFDEISLHDIVLSTFLNLRLDAEQTEDFESLVASIRKYGLLQPLIVRYKHANSPQGMMPDKVELVCGHRRLAACKKLSIETIPCFVMELEDKEALEVALIDNVQRQSLSPIEEAEAFKLYVVSFGRGSVTALAHKIGKSEEYVSHRLLLLGLPKELKDRISSRLLNPTHATELVWLHDREKQLQLADEVQRRNLTLRQTRKVANLMKRGLPLKQAVSGATNNERSIDGKVIMARYGLEVLSDEPDKLWQNSSKSSYQEEENLKVLDNAILVLRTSLAGLDLLVSKATEPDLQAFVLNLRLRVHETLNEAIRHRVDRSRQIKTQIRICGGSHREFESRSQLQLPMRKQALFV